jgi:hypothetical protein
MNLIPIYPLSITHLYLEAKFHLIGDRSMSMVGYLVCKRDQLRLTTSLGPEAMLAVH